MWNDFYRFPKTKPNISKISKQGRSCCMCKHAAWIIQGITWVKMSYKIFEDNHFIVSNVWLQNCETGIWFLPISKILPNISTIFKQGYAGARANMWNDSSESDKYLNSVSSCAGEEMHQKEKRRDYFSSSGWTLKKANMCHLNVNDQ